MEELLKKVNEYGIKHYRPTLSLILEVDGSGFITKNIFDWRDGKENEIFEFNNINELNEFLDK